MWLLLAHEHDIGAHELVLAFPASVRLVTPDAIGPEGWTLEMGSNEVAGCSASSPVDGVVTRLLGIGPWDLRRMHPDDRAYAAAELDAFLLAWLDACPAPVLNRPSPGTLNGPGWSSFAWSISAHHAGLRTEPAPDVEPAAVITVVGDRVLGGDGVDAGAVEAVYRLARAAGTTLLEVTLDGTGPDAAFLGASACPTLDPPVVDALAGFCGWT
jgi:hypothetical protein